MKTVEQDKGYFNNKLLVKVCFLGKKISSCCPLWILFQRKIGIVRPALLEEMLLAGDTPFTAADHICPFAAHCAVPLMHWPWYLDRLAVNQIAEEQVFSFHLFCDV